MPFAILAWPSSINDSAASNRNRQCCFASLPILLLTSLLPSCSGYSRPGAWLRRWQS